MVRPGVVIGVALTCAACVEPRFEEVPEPLVDCSGRPQSGGGGRDGQLELGRLEGATFVPFVGDEQHELYFGGDSVGWGILAAVRLPSQEFVALQTQCLPGSVVQTPGSEVFMPLFAVQWVGESNGTGGWVSLSQMLIPVGDDVVAIVGRPITLQVLTTLSFPLGVYWTSTRPMTFTYVNHEGHLATP